MEIMTKEPLVSCIIPFLNSEKFLDEAIDSVLNQTHENWEIILVDDGSKDGSTEVALNYAKENPNKIFYFEHKNHQNLGSGVSRNLGIKFSKGEYIAFLDADDIWLPNKLEKQIKILEENPEVGMVFGPHYIWFSWTKNPKDAARDEIFLPIWDSNSNITPNTILSPPKLFIAYLYNKVGTPLTCGVLIRKKVVEEVGGFDDQASFLNEDGPFFAKIYLKTPVYLESDCWDRYRQHPESTVTKAKARREWFDDRYFQPVHKLEMQILKNFLLNQGIQDPEIWKAIESQLLPYQNSGLYFIKLSAGKIKNSVKLLIPKIQNVFSFL